MIKNYAAAGIVALGMSVAALSPAAAEQKIEELNATLTGGVGLATDYLFRGISQTQTEPAIQGSLDLQHASGLYVGVFASNVDFPGVDANIEIDVGAGYRFNLGPVALDVGVVHYAYPGARKSLHLPYTEGILKASYELSFVTFVGMVAYSPDYQSASDTGIYVEGGADFKLPWELTLGARLGHQWINENSKFGVPDFLNWSLGISRDFYGFTFAVTYADTDLSKRECFGGTNLCEARVLASVTKKF
jgi:uncharacterized protein (TIGR02001 family)